METPMTPTDESGNLHVKVTKINDNVVIQFNSNTENTESGDAPKKIKLDLIMPENLNLTFDIFLNKEPLLLGFHRGNNVSPESNGTLQTAQGSSNEYVAELDKSDCDNIKSRFSCPQHGDFLGDILDDSSRGSTFSLIRHINPFLPLTDQVEINNMMNNLSNVGVQTDVLLGGVNIPEVETPVEMDPVNNPKGEISEEEPLDVLKCPLELLSLKDLANINADEYREKFSEFFCQLKSENPCEYVDLLYKIYMIPVRYLLSLYSNIEDIGPLVNIEKQASSPSTILPEDNVNPLLAKLMNLENAFEILKVKCMPTLEGRKQPERPPTPYHDALSDAEPSEFFECNSEQTGFYSKSSTLCQNTILGNDNRVKDGHVGDCPNCFLHEANVDKELEEILLQRPVDKMTSVKQNFLPIFSDPNDVLF